MNMCLCYFCCEETPWLWQLIEERVYWDWLLVSEGDRHGREHGSRQAKRLHSSRGLVSYLQVGSRDTRGERDTGHSGLLKPQSPSQVGLELTIVLPLSPKCWDGCHALLYLFVQCKTTVVLFLIIPSLILLPFPSSKIFIAYSQLRGCPRKMVTLLYL